MAIGTPTVRGEKTTNSTGQGSIARAPTGTISAGSLLVVMVGFGLASTPTVSVSDTQGNTYQQDARADKTTGNTPHSGIFSSILDTQLTTGDTVTVTFGTNVNYPMMALFEVTGIADTSWLDKTATATGSSTAPDTGDTATTAQADELLFSVACWQAAATFTPGTDFTQVGTTMATTTKYGASQYDIVSSTGAYDGDATLGSSQDWAICLATYKGESAAAAAATAVPLKTLMGVGL